MADNKVLIDLLVDPKTAKAGLREFETYLNKLQNSASKAGSTTKVPQLPREAKERLTSTKAVNTSDTAELKKQVRERAKLIALAQQEASLTARASGGKASTAELGKIKAIGSAALAKSLGLDKLPANLQKELDTVARQTRQAISKSLNGLDIDPALKAFQQQANTILSDVGVTTKSRIRSAGVVDAENQRRVAPTRAADTSTSDAKIKKVSEQQARDTERSAASQKASQAKSDKALANKAAADARAAKAADQEVIDRKTFYSRGGRTRAETNAAERERRAGVRADQGDYVKDLEQQYGPEIVKEAKSRRKADFPAFKQELQQSLDSVTEDFVKNYTGGVRSDVEKVNPRTNKKYKVREDPLGEIRRTVQDGLAHTLGSEYDFIKADLMEAYAPQPGRKGVKSDRLRLFEKYSKEWAISLESFGDHLLDNFNPEDMMQQLQQIDSLREQTRAPSKAQPDLGTYAERIAREKEDILVRQDKDFLNESERRLQAFADDDRAARSNDAAERRAIRDIPDAPVRKGGAFDDAESRSLLAAANSQMAEEWQEQIGYENQSTKALQQEALFQQQSTQTAGTRAAQGKAISAAQLRALDIIKANPGVSLSSLQDQGVRTSTLAALENRNLVSKSGDKFNVSDGLGASESVLTSSLQRKIEALNAQSRILESNFVPFSAAEEGLIAALNRKSAALGNQTGAIPKANPVNAAAKANTNPFGAGDAKPSSPAAGAGGAGGGFKPPFDISGFDPEDGFNPVQAAMVRVNSAAMEQATLYELFNSSIEPLMAAELAAYQAMVRALNNQLKVRTFNNVSDDAGLAQTEAALEVATRRLAASRFALVNQPGIRDEFINAKANESASRLSLDTDVRQALNDREGVQTDRQRGRVISAESRANTEAGIVGNETLFSRDIAAALSLQLSRIQSSAAKWELIAEDSGTIASLSGRERFLRNQLNDKIEKDYLERVAIDAGLSPDAPAGRAVLDVDRIENRADSRESILDDPTLETRYVKAQNRLIDANTELAAKVERLALSTPSVLQSRVEKVAAQREGRLSVDEAYYRTPQGIDDLKRRAALSSYKREVTGQGGPQQTPFKKFTSDPGGFFGAGALTSLKYGLPSMLLYGAGTGIMTTIQEAEQLNVALAKLQDQYAATFGDSVDFSTVRQGIVDIAKDTGLAADEIANLQIQITGAFSGKDVKGNQINIDGNQGVDLVNAQVASAAKLAQTVGLPLAEITDGLTAASLAFDASFERIGDVALSIEQQSGVLAKETISFIGDIAPVAQEAGYSLEEFAAIAAVAQQRSGRSGTALAESFGRVIPAITEQKDKLLELAAIDPALGSDQFVDAIRSSDPKAILDEIGRSYNSLNKEAQQAIVSLLGGRREAQALIPALANQNLTDRLQKAAENSTGTLDERFQKIRATLTNTLQRITQAVRELGIVLLDAGLADVFEGALKAAQVFLDVLSPIARLLGTINDFFGGFPIQILAGVTALKLFQALLTNAETGTVKGGRITNAMFGPQGILQNATAGYNGGIAGNFRQGVLQSRGISPYSAAGQSLRTSSLLGAAKANPVNAAAKANTNPFGAGPIGAARAGGRGALSALGGGSVALGGTFVGIAALTALYGWVNNEKDKAEAELEELRKEIDRDNEKLDLENIDIRTDRIEELRNRAEDEAKRVDAWYSSWNGLLSQLNLIQTKAEVLAGEAQVLENFDKNTTEFFTTLTNEELNLVSDVAAPKLGRGTAKFRDAISKYDVNGTDPITGNGFKLDPSGKIRNASAKFNPVAAEFYRADEQAFIEQSARLAGVEVPELDPRIVQLLLDPAGNPASLLEDAANLNGDYADFGADFAAQADAIRKEFESKGMNDADISAAINSAREAFDASQNLEDNQLAVDQLKAAFDLGQISLEEYSKRLSERLKQRREILTAGEDTKATELQILQVLQEEAAANKELSDAIVSRQEIVNKIAEAYGADENEANLNTYQQSLSNLNNQDFKDPEARLNAALAAVEAKKKIDLAIAEQSGDLNAVAKLLAEGSQVPEEARAEIAAALAFTDEAFINFAGAYDSLLAQVDEVDGGQALKDRLQGKGTKGSRTAVKSTPFLSRYGKNAKEITSNLLKDVLDDDGLSGGANTALNAQLEKYASDLKNQGLTKEQKEALLNASDGIVDILTLAGVGRDKILDALAGGDFDSLSEADKKKILTRYENLTADTPFASLPDERAAFSEEEAKKQKDLQEDRRRAQFELQRAQADRNSAELARIDQLEASYDLELANALPDGLEKEAAKLRAQASAIRANQSSRDAVKAAFDSQIALMSAVAQVNGDLSGVAALEVQRLANEVNVAAASGDPNLGALQGQLILAQDAVRKSLLEDQLAPYGIFATYLEGEGDALNAAIARQKEAQIRLDNARGPQERAQAEIAKLQADQQVRAAQAALRDASYALFSSEIAGEDPLAQARVAEALAKEQLKDARGAVERANAQVNLNNAQRALADAMQEARYSMYSLRQSELQAMDDEVGAAQVAAELARQQLNDAISRGAGTATINNLRAQVITADKQARDTVINEKLDEYKWLLDMGQITQSQYVRYLESLQSTLAPGSKQFKDLALTIKQLKDGISGDLQANLPTSLTLPTLYEVRRFNQTGANSGGATSAGIGYQDNRQVSVEFNINGADPDVTSQVVAAMEDVLGVNRSGYGQRRF